MKHRQDEKRFFVRDIGDQEIPHDVKSQRMRSQVWTKVTLMRRACQRSERFIDFSQNAIGCVQIVPGNELPDFVEVTERFG